MSLALRRSQSLSAIHSLRLHAGALPWLRDPFDPEAEPQ